MESNALTHAKIAKMLGKCNRTVIRWIKAGQLPASKIGRTYIIKQYDFDKFLNDHRVKR